MTPKQQRFIEEYLVDLNATQAAIRAGYSERTAYSQGQRLLKNVEVAISLREAMEKRSERTEITADRVLSELSKLAYANMLDYIQVQENGTAVIDLSELDRDQAAAIQEIVTDEYWEGRGDGAVEIKKIKFKLADKKAALDLLGKHLGIFTDRLDVTSDGKSLNLLIQPIRPEAA